MGEAATTRWAVTFGQRYRTDPHPLLPDAHPDGFALVQAPDESLARVLVAQRLGIHWSHIYPFDTDEERAEMDRFFPRGAIANLGTVEATGFGYTAEATP